MEVDRAGTLSLPLSPLGFERVCSPLSGVRMRVFTPVCACVHAMISARPPLRLVIWKFEI